MKRVNSNILSNIIGQFIILILGFISTKYIYTKLGGESVGIVYFALMANATLCTILELGICSTTVKGVSENYNKNQGYTQLFIRSFSSFYWVVYLIFCIIIYFATPFLTRNWLNLHQIDHQSADTFLRILLTSSLLALPKSFYASVLRGVQQMGRVNLIDSITAAAQQLGLLVIITVQHGNLLSIAKWLAVTHVLSLTSYLIACTSYFTWRTTFLPGFSTLVYKDNFKYTLSMSVVSLTALAYLQFDKIILSKLLPIDVFGYYYFSYSLVSKGTLLTMAISQAFFPYISSIYATSDANTIERQYSKFHNLLCLANIPTFAVISFAAIPLFSYLFNPVIANDLLLPTIFLCVGFYMTGTLTLPNNIIFAANKPNIIAKQNIYSLILVLPVTYFLVKSWGAIGASLSIVTYSIFCYIYSIPIICSQCIGISTRSWFMHIAKIILLSILTYGFPLILIYHHIINGPIIIMVSYTISTLLFFIGALYILPDDLKKKLYELPPVYAAIQLRIRCKSTSN